MPKRNDLTKILVIGSGPIVIGQAAEFDYAGTQACLALKEEGYEVVLINSNPATIMTDTEIADKVYMEPITLEYVSKIIRKERPDAVIPGLGGQTGLNMVMELAKRGILDECQVEVLGTDLDAIDMAEDRELFKDLCNRIGEPVIESKIAENIEDVITIANEIGYPIVLRPAFTLGGTGGGFAYNDEEARKIGQNAIKLSPASQVLVEKSVKGYKEVEYEVMRDKNDTAIIICNMENIDPVGIHTGDSAVVAPSQTLTNKEYQMLRNSSLNIIRNLGIEGGCNAQFALDPNSNQYYVIEVNPRVSRSSALASKATGYPIAYVSTKIAVGYTLDEIMLKNTPACFEPALDYVVSKLARFPFDKFASANRLLSTQMKATGEVMAIGRTFEESFLKAVRSLENGQDYLELDQEMTTDELLEAVVAADDNRLYVLAELLRRGVNAEKIIELTKIDKFFVEKIAKIIAFETTIINNKFDAKTLLTAKKLGFGDQTVAKLWDVSEKEVSDFRQEQKITPVYKMIDSCASEFGAYIPYFYSTYEKENESIVSEREKVLVIGSGPIRIGQGVEFDYSTVHAIKTIQKKGYEAIVINSNPETVSTDYSTSDKLYFEPLNIEDVMNVINLEKPMGVIVQLGGQTPINLVDDLEANGVTILGTSAASINQAEDRDLFENLLEELQIDRPRGAAITSVEAGIKAANEIGYPVLVRPSFVLGGRAMRIVKSDAEIQNYLTEAVKVNTKHPVLVDQYMQGKEVEVDALSDLEDIFIPGIMEHIEKTGVHSGDSISVYPSFSLSDNVKQKIIETTTKIGKGLKIKGLFNIQFIVTPDDNVYIIEVNPRASRSVPFISKVTKNNLSVMATEIMLGETIKSLGINTNYHPEPENNVYVKAPTFSFSKIQGLDTYLSPEMKSTGEAIGYDTTLNKALHKALEASGLKLSGYGTVLITVSDEFKEKSIEIARRFYELGFNLVATANTAKELKAAGLKVKTLGKISEGNNEILEWIQKGYIKYIVNLGVQNSGTTQSDGFKIRTTAAINNVSTFTSLDTINAILDILEERSINVDTI